MQTTIMLDDLATNQLLFCYPVFHRVSARLLRNIRVDGHCLGIPDEHLVFDLDSPCNAFVMPLSGAIRVTRTALSGREILLYRLEPGESCIITVSCLLGNIPSIACGRAEGNLAVVLLPKALFLKMVEESEPFRVFVFQHFGQRLSQLAELIEAIAFQNLDQRLAALLLDQGPLLEVTHQMLASELGSVREVVSRILQSFRDQGVIELDRGRIMVLDESKLLQISQTNL
jgi:CRP/FNR family transcriptional regulator